jgi:hypothetical protein
MKMNFLMINTAIKSDNNGAVMLDNKEDILIPTPNRVDLKSIDDVRLEMAKVYRSMKSGELQSSDGTRLVYVLAQIGKMIELHEVEKRLVALEIASERKR